MKLIQLMDHSLGEYTALVCAGSLTIEKAAYLLHERGKSMQDAVPSGQGTMMAILGMTIDEVEKNFSNWTRSHGGFSSMRFSSLDLINKSNISNEKWTISKYGQY